MIIKFKSVQIVSLLGLLAAAESQASLPFSDQPNSGRIKSTGNSQLYAQQDLKLDDLSKQASALLKKAKAMNGVLTFQAEKDGDIADFVWVDAE